MGKGSKQRPTDLARFGDNYDQIFGKPFTGKLAMPQQTCSTCKYWTKFLPSDPVPYCQNIAVTDFADGFNGLKFETSADFGCNLWEPK